jgi:hypothetical protein
MLLKLCATMLGIATFPAVFAATDYVFTSSFENLVCDGAACTYCSPIDPHPLCGSDSHCTPQTDSTSVCSYPAGPSVSGSACSALADCSGPMACINTGISMTCRNWCAVPGGVCPVGQTCTALSPGTYTGGTEWGVCL